MSAAPFSAAGVALSRFGEIRLKPDTLRPYVGIFGVLLGSIISTLGARVTSFGLADVRGGLGFSFDEGAWITTAFGVGQMLVGVTCPYLGALFGVRRVLLTGIALFFTTSLLAPLAPNVQAYLTMQFLGGVGSGTFIPLTISFILRSLPARLVIYGVAIYAMNSELSQNVAASLEGWFADHLSWRWINWQYCGVLPLMFAAIFWGVPKEKLNAALLPDLDWPGMTYAAIGFSLLYAAVDQGNRLDWLNSGLVVGLLLSGGLLTAVFVARELRTPRPFLNLAVLARGNLPLLLLMLAGFRFIILSTAYIIPSYLQGVQNFRELQVGQVLLWIALPQIVIVLPLAALLIRVEGRLVLAAGTAMVGVACVMAMQLTSQWATDDFLVSQILQALGQSFALTALLVLTVRSLNAAEALTAGTLVQICRLFGGELGTAFMQTFVRMREQVHSNLIGLHVNALAGATTDRLAAYTGAVQAHTSDLGEAAARASRLLANMVAQQAAVLSYIDGFAAAAAGAFLCLVIVALMRPSPPSAF